MSLNEDLINQLKINPHSIKAAFIKAMPSGDRATKEEFYKSDKRITKKNFNALLAWLENTIIAKELPYDIEVFRTTWHKDKLFSITKRFV
jgi:hypothetical protein